MNPAVRNGNGRAHWYDVPLGIAKGTVLSFYEHWTLALFSLVAAFAIWFVVQDVENPRVQVTFPPEGEPPSIEVQPVNADRLLPDQSYFVRVQLEGREDDLALLSPDSFEATIDVSGIPANSPTAVPVRVTSNIDGVKVLSVEPSTIVVTLEPVVEEQFDIRINPSGQVPPGFLVQDRKIEPLTVTVSGLARQLELVASVGLDVNLSSLQDGTNTFEGDLIARTATNSIIDVSISPARAKVTYTVSQQFVQRSVSVSARVAGQVAPGYKTGAVVIEPPIISVSGPADQIPQELATEPIQLGNARSEIRLVANIAKPDNISLERDQVSVRIEVKPIECTGGTAGTPCGPLSLPVAPTFTNPPANLVVTSPATLRIYVQLTGPLAVLDTLTSNPGQITASIDLAGAVSGQSAYNVTVNIPTNLSNQGVRAEPVPPVTLTLGPG